MGTRTSGPLDRSTSTFFQKHLDHTHLLLETLWLHPPGTTVTLNEHTYYYRHSGYTHLFQQTLWPPRPGSTDLLNAHTTTVYTLTTPICSYTYSEYTRLLQQTLWPHPPALSQKKKKNTYLLILIHWLHLNWNTLTSDLFHLLRQKV